MATNQISQSFKTPNSGLVNLSTNLYLTNVILIAKFDYESKESHELDLKKNERLILIDSSKNWWLVKKYDSDQTGYIPSNYVKKEKKSLLEKIIPRKLHNTSTQINIKQNISNEDIKTSFKNGSSLNFISKAIVKHKYNAEKSDELTLNSGVEVKVLEKFGDGWWKVAVLLENQNKELIGLYPSNYLREETNTNANNPYMPGSSVKNQNSTFDILNNQDTNNPAKCESISSNEKEIEYVRVRYAHQAENINELSVSVNEILRVVDDDNEFMENDKPWLKVFNSHGLMGFIPFGCVEPILDHQMSNFVFIRRPSKVGVFANKNWYFGNISRFDTIILFEKYAIFGDFLVRDSDGGSYSISLKSEGSNVKHFKINTKDNTFVIGKKSFDSMDYLLQHYHKYPINDQNGEKLYLIKPFDPPQQSTNEFTS